MGSVVGVGVVVTLGTVLGSGKGEPSFSESPSPEDTLWDRGGGGAENMSEGAQKWNSHSRHEV